MHMFLTAALAVLTGSEPNYDGTTFSYKLADYDVPFRSGVKVQTSPELVPEIFYIEDGKLFCLEQENDIEPPF